MASIRENSATDQGGKGESWDQKPPVITQKTGSAEASDRELMYAWSIGVTRAAREMEEQSAKVEETCPPEVYIG